MMQIGICLSTAADVLKPLLLTVVAAIQSWLHLSCLEVIESTRMKQARRGMGLAGLVET